MATAKKATPAAAGNGLLLGARLRQLRRAKGMTVEELARAVDVDKAHVSRLENDVKTPSIGMLAQLAQALGVSMGHLLGETLDKSEITVTRAAELDDGAGEGVGAQHRFLPLLHGHAVGSFEAFLVYPGSDAGEVEARHAGQEMLFIVAGAFVLAGACLVLPIRSVR